MQPFTVIIGSLHAKTRDSAVSACICGRLKSVNFKFRATWRQNAGRSLFDVSCSLYDSLTHYLFSSQPDVYPKDTCDKVLL